MPKPPAALLNTILIMPVIIIHSLSYSRKVSFCLKGICNAFFFTPQDSKSRISMINSLLSKQDIAPQKWYCYP